MARGGDGEGEILGYKTSSHSLAYPSGVFESHLYYSKRVRVILYKVIRIFFPIQNTLRLVLRPGNFGDILSFKGTNILG